MGEWWWWVIVGCRWNARVWGGAGCVEMDKRCMNRFMHGTAFRMQRPFLKGEFGERAKPPYRFSLVYNPPSSLPPFSPGLSAALARRFLSKRILWFCRMETDDIAKLHGADLRVKYVEKSWSYSV